MGFRQIPLNEFLSGQYENTFRQKNAAVHPDLWQAYNPNADYGAATGDYAGAGGANQQAWMANRVLGGQTPEAYFDQYNRSRGIDPATFTDWRIGGARYDPATGMVLQSDDMGGDPFGGLAMGGALGFLSGVGALGSLSGLTGGADLGAGGLGTSASGYGFGTPESLIGADAGAGSGIADLSWGVNPQGGSMDWWSEYGLTPADVGMEAGGWTTNPSFSDLMGGAVNMGGAVPPYTTGGGIMDWLKTNKDAVGLLGKGGATLLGLLGSKEKSDALKQLYERSQANRQPFLGQATQWLNDPASFMNGPGKSAMDANLRALSARYGNPIDSPTALSLANDAALRNWLGAVTGMGGVGLGGEATQASLGSQAANAQGGAYDALGYGLNALTNPQPSLTDILKLIQGGGFKIGSAETV